MTPKGKSVGSKPSHPILGINNSEGEANVGHFFLPSFLFPLSFVLLHSPSTLFCFHTHTHSLLLPHSPSLSPVPGQRTIDMKHSNNNSKRHSGSQKRQTSSKQLLHQQQPQQQQQDTVHTTTTPTNTMTDTKSLQFHDIYLETRHNATEAHSPPSSTPPSFSTSDSRGHHPHPHQRLTKRRSKKQLLTQQQYQQAQAQRQKQQKQQLVQGPCTKSRDLYADLVIVFKFKRLSKASKTHQSKAQQLGEETMEAYQDVLNKLTNVGLKYESRPSTNASQSSSKEATVLIFVLCPWAVLKREAIRNG